MKRILVLLQMLILLFVFVSCSGDKNDTENSQEDKPSGDQNDMMEAVDKMKEMMSGELKVETVNFRELKELLPERIGELARENATGESNAAFGMKISKAEADYFSPDSQSDVHIEITDLGSLKGLTAMTGFAWALGEYDRETENGYEKTTTYEGFKAMEEYDYPSKSGKINVLVADRFSVNIEGNNIAIEDIKNILKQIDLEKLVSLKDFGIEK